MLKDNKWKIVISTLIVLLPMLAGILLWNRLPERMPIHWNTMGEVDGWSGKAFAVFAIPGFLAAIHLLCVACTSLDPKVKGQTKKVLGLVFWICPFMSVLVEAVTYAVTLGASVSVDVVLMAALGLLFVVIGNYMPKCKSNYTIGIKVMWALENEANWNATHRFAGKVWVAGGICMILASFIPLDAKLWILLAATLLMALLSIAYSYLYFRGHKKAE